MTPHREELLELCAGYVLGNLTEPEKGTFEEHLKAGCPTCEAEVHRLGRGVWAFAAATPRLLEPSALRARVLGTVRGDTGRRAPIPLPRRRAPVMGWVGAIAAVVIAAFAVLEWRAASLLKRELTASREEISRLNQQIQSEREWAAVATAPQTRVIELAPTPAGSAMLRARVTYDPVSRRAIVAVSNFAAPAGKDYQLWAILKTGPSSLGLVRADNQGRAMLRLTDAGDPAALGAFAVSLEQEGGAPTTHAPAGPVVMVGKIGT